MIESYITSSIEGRLRIRHPFIRDINLAEAIFTFLKEQALLSNINVNPRTGSILIEYDHTKTTQDEIIGNLEAYAMSYCMENGYLEELLKFEQSTNDKTCLIGNICKVSGFLDKPRYRCLINRTMLVFLASSIGFAFFDRMRGHVFTSVIFAALSAAHLYSYRKKI